MPKVYVAGVGMIPFRKPGDSLPYHEMGAVGDTPGTRRRRARVRSDSTGVRRLRVRRFDFRPARRVRGRHDRHSGGQRQQQLLDRIDGIVSRPPGGRERRRRMRARRRLRADAAGGAHHALERPAQHLRAFRSSLRRAGGRQGASARDPLLRRRRAGSTCNATAPSSRPSPRCAPRRAGTRRRIRSRCCARSTRSTTSCSRR